MSCWLFVFVYSRGFIVFYHLLVYYTVTNKSDDNGGIHL